MPSAETSSNMITILHFNDVYNVEPRAVEPCGGAARFVHLIKSFSYLNPIVLFSGDIFAPSFLSIVTKGAHMSPILNEIGTQCAVFGNHEFDFGLEVLADRVSETNFPWLMSNVIDNKTGRPLAEGKVSHIIDWNGKRIGLIGLVEPDWLETIITLNINDITFLDYVEVAEKLGFQLKEEGCDYVIALTHMRTRHDQKLAENSSYVDLILGGHDHVFEIRKINDKYVIKSGTDFRQFSKITLTFQDDDDVNVDVEEICVTKSVPEDDFVKTLLEKYQGSIGEKMNEVLGVFSVPLEGRFSKIRTEETNLGNWFCDILLDALEADLVLINSGTFRSDQIHPAGNFTLGDLMRVIPDYTSTVKLKVTGRVLHQVLENAVSKYPAFEGRFLQAAGVHFTFDPAEPPGKRVDPLLVRVRGEYLDMDQNYSMATKTFLRDGGDGYYMLTDAEVLISHELSPDLGICVRNYLASVKTRGGMDETSQDSEQRVKQVENNKVDSSSLVRSHDDQPEYEHSSKDNSETKSSSLAPIVEGRIVKLTPQVSIYLEFEMTSLKKRKTKEEA